MSTPANFADAQFDKAVADLEQILVDQRETLDPRTVVVIERNLAVIDEAIRQARAALDADPANTYLNSHLADARRRKLDLLRRATIAVVRRLGKVLTEVLTMGSSRRFAKAGSDDDGFEGESSMIRIWCLATAGRVDLLAATSAAAQDRRRRRQQPPIQARPGGPEGSQRTDQTLDVAKGTRLVLEQQRRRSHRPLVGSRAGPRAGVAQRSRTRRHPDRRHDAADSRARHARAGQSDRLSDHRAALDAGQSRPAPISSRPSKARPPKSPSKPFTATCAWSAARAPSWCARSKASITVEKATGKVQATTVNEGIRLSNVSGDMTAETTNGDIVIENAQTTSLEVSTVNGDVTFNGTMRDGGAYRLTTHGGDIRVGLGGAPNATVFVRTFQGDFSADFPIQLPEGQTRARAAASASTSRSAPAARASSCSRSTATSSSRARRS